MVHRSAGLKIIDVVHRSAGLTFTFTVRTRSMRPPSGEPSRTSPATTTRSELAAPPTPSSPTAASPPSSPSPTATSRLSPSSPANRGSNPDRSLFLDFPFLHPK
ncbi:hypothetical protein LOK49_LG15G00879 [Camellia lanceoleosa]|uniref:Uncharacterized protein n=1 Tax=Camellia lanceoleosa TaxID=1840588 RepID=A0ACC0F6X2_9ERIC|nr:hypothetical protein LOK49_LG15G00879 [Camellia lanceoleosa]